MSQTGGASRESLLPTSIPNSQLGEPHPLYDEFLYDGESILVHRGIHLVDMKGQLSHEVWSLYECPIGCGAVWNKSGSIMLQTVKNAFHLHHYEPERLASSGSKPCTRIY